MSENSALVIGAGFGGLSAAALLAKNGYDVTVLEKNGLPGGRARVYEEKGFRFDMGPSWYLMPDVFERFFALFDRRPEDFYRLVRLDPAYRAFFGPDKALDVAADLGENLDLFEGLEEGGASKLQAYLDQSEYQYEAAMEDFIYKEYRNVFDFLDLRLLTEGRKLRVFESMDRFVARFFEDEVARKVLQYNLVFLGGSPKTTPALYSIMSHIDLNLGVWYPMGGLGRVVQGLHDLAVAEGATFEFDQEVQRIEVEGGQARGVRTHDGLREADLVVVNADYHHAETRLLAPRWQTYPERYWSRRTVAPSSLIFYLGLDRPVESLAHHNLVLESDWVRHFDAIFEAPAWPEDPSYYVCAPSRTDPDVAPDGGESLFVLIPVAAGLEDTPAVREGYYDRTLRHLERLTGESLRDRVVHRRSYAHRDFQRDYHAYRGTALGLTHTLRQTAAFRPSHRSRKVRNLYYTGQYTHPGIGVPMALISSQIVAKEIGPAA